jgi:hypothetical protein
VNIRLLVRTSFSPGSGGCHQQHIVVSTGAFTIQTTSETTYIQVVRILIVQKTFGCFSSFMIHDDRRFCVESYHQLFLRTNRAHWLPTAWVYRRSTVYRLLETWFSPSTYTYPDLLRAMERSNEYICVHMHPRVAWGPWRSSHRTHSEPTCRYDIVSDVFIRGEAKSTGDKISGNIARIPACTRYIRCIIYRFQHTVRFCIVSRVQNLET